MKIDFDKELAEEAVSCGFAKIITRNGYVVDIIDWGYSGQVLEYTIGGGLSREFVFNGRIKVKEVSSARKTHMT